MIPKLFLTTGYPRARQPLSPFEINAARPLRIVVDDAGGGRPSPAMNLLKGFEHHDSVTMYCTREGARRRLRLRECPSEDAVRANVDKENGAAELFVSGLRNKQMLAAHLSKSAPIRRVIVRRLILGHIADALGADANVATSIAVSGEPRRGNPMTPTAACSLLGLYLRACGDHTWLRREGGQWSLDARTFHVVLLRHLLPEAVRLVDALPPAASPWEPGPFGFGTTLLVRAERAVRARDALHRCFLREQKGDASDEALVAFDSFLVNAGAAFDALAQIVHVAYAVKLPSHLIGWRRAQWSAAAKAAAPGVAAVMQEGTLARDLLDLISLFRNTIHGHALETIAFMDTARGRDTEYPLVVPARFERDFAGLAQRRGGLRRLGVRRLPGGPYILELDVFVERTLPLALRAIDSVSAAIDVERIPGSRTKATGRISKDLWGQRRAVGLLTGLRNGGPLR